MKTKMNSRSPTMAHPTYSFQHGSKPVLISIPHLGTQLPAEVRARYAPVAAELADTDWHLDRLYAFAAELGASIIAARVSRYVIDLNRPPTDESLYPGQTTTGLCPGETFRGETLYLPGHAPDAAERARRIDTYWRPYHHTLEHELQRLRAEHGAVLLWEAHSIASVLPRLFEGKLPDLNFGTADGKSCDAGLAAKVVGAVQVHPAARELTHVVNGRFKGGYITRRYGNPAQGVHAIQLEMCQSLYMDEAAPFGYVAEKAAAVQPVLGAALEAALGELPRLAEQHAALS